METYNQWPADGSLPEIVTAFLEWLLIPKWERTPKTQTAWAEAHGSTASTVACWKRDKRFKAEFKRRCDELNLGEYRTQEMLDAVYNAGVTGDMNAAKLWLQHVNQLAPKRIIIEDATIANLSDEELTRKLVDAGLLSE